MLADRLLEHVLNFQLDGSRLPKGIHVLDPFNGAHGEQVKEIVRTFHRRFYDDDAERLLMLGINPGRLGAGSTGLPFTDTKRCEADLRIPVQGMRTHEPSSDFFYRMINANGGPGRFYSKVYVHAVCPLGFVKEQPAGKPVNLNYYDDKDLEKAVMPFMEQWLKDLVATGMRTDGVICLGTGKNAAAFLKLNARLKLFEKIHPIEHPRFIIQYKQKHMEAYIQRYIHLLHLLTS
jgi:hypothetical protein